MTTSPLSVPQAPGRLVTVAVLLVASMTIMANATIAPSLPGLKAHFADAEGIETLSALILTLPSLSVILTAGLFGYLADRMDRRLLLAIATGVYAIGGASGLVAETLPQLLMGRLLLGIGVAGSMTLAMAFAADLWQGEARARFMGLQGASMSGGGVVVMLLGGALAALHWRGAFGVYLLALPISALALTALWPYARRAQPAAPVAGERPVGFPWPTFAFVGGLSFLFMATFYVMPTRVPFRLAEIGVTNSLIVGLVMAGVMVTSVPGALMYGKIRRHLSEMAIFAASFGLMGVGLFTVSQSGSLWGVALGGMIAGAGMGPAMPNYSTYLMAKVPPAARGRAAGLLTTSFFAGQFASPLVSAPLVASFGISGAFLALSVALLVIGIALALRAGHEASGRRRAWADV
ncbi:MFS transporter [Frigidibacter albus]|uniref:MFS transporter n=1 Tax=Frigidibacter albus TaxID=1465486 RepID=A0A6L8VDA9_9RHOB|nr:MFS transporter [Frigidibacter albus]MZQ88287.1 MFS transporter [Frigidibacter albus]NBE30039.1 MFS transporter [Frigidibacter albus]GGH46327.1 MFS transporter [Frigidibacter albus]